MRYLFEYHKATGPGTVTKQDCFISFALLPCNLYVD